MTVAELRIYCSWDGATRSNLYRKSPNGQFTAIYCSTLLLTRRQGCWKCRARKVKCDETKPSCLACRRIGVECAGYGQNFIWVEDDGTIGVSQGRRVLSSESTWKGFEILSSDLVDLLITQCDETADVANNMSTIFYPSCITATHNPFAVIKFDTLSYQRPQTVSVAGVWNESSSLIIPGMTTFPQWTHDEKFLFHHYVNHVAIIMLPYEHPRNIWKSHYPAIALEMASTRQNFLSRALLAHAAFNISHLRGHDEGFLRLGLKQYGEAMQALIDVIGNDEVDFTPMIASIMTLMFAELYNGLSRSWRQHFEGAWTLFKKNCKSQLWASTEMARVSLQSLNIIKIIGDTSKSENPPKRETNSYNEDVEPSPIFSTSDFGFTIGAPKTILDCIARITKFRMKRKHGCKKDVNGFLARELASLGRYHRKLHPKYDDLGTDGFIFDSNEDTLEDESPEAIHQREAFIHATYIYLYRSLLDTPPHAVKSHVERTFAHVSAFFASSNGNFSIWPAFIAASEAYTDHDLAEARQWLDSATSFGIGSRDLMRRVLEEIWRRREALSEASGLEKGSIGIDWRDVMQELDCDVLLI